MKLIRIVALLGSALTLVQIFLLAGGKTPICLNDGCEVVDSLTLVPVLVVNLAGFVFFQAVFWGGWWAAKKKDGESFVYLLLTAGLAVEGVLVSFQHFIAQTFCSYCLIIFGIILLLNILAGYRQLFTGLSVFAAVIVGFSALNFGGGSSFDRLDSGSLARIEGDGAGSQHYLFFSSTCKHCEVVIEKLGNGNTCSFRFNPIDEIEEFHLSSAVLQEDYDTGVNRSVLQSMGIKQIPTLIIRKENDLRVLTGAGLISDYIDEACSLQTPDSHSSTSSSINTSPEVEYLPQDEEACSVDADCEEPQGYSSPQRSLY